jgi:VWFA-related protein
VLQRRTDDQGGADSPGQYGQQPRTQQAGQQSSGQQTSGQQSGGKDETIKLDATLVNLPLLVSDRSGRFIPQLSKRDFDIYEDGVKQEIAFFGNEEVPFNVALMLDVSPSVSNSLRDIQDAAIAFVKELRPEDRIMIVAFDRNVRFLTDFTNDRYVLERAIDNTRTGNGTSVYEAVYDTVENRLRHVDGRKAMILLSDGEDTTSRSVGYEEAINCVQESDVLVYGLRFPDTGGYGPNYPRNRNPYPYPFPSSRWPFPFPWPHFVPLDPAAGSGGSSNGGQWGHRKDTSHGRDFLADVAEAGGGPVYDAKTVHDMARLARQIADELRHVYVVSYYPTNSLSNGGYRSIRVQVHGRDDIAVRHRRGYDATEVRSRPSI